MLGRMFQYVNSRIGPCLREQRENPRGSSESGAGPLLAVICSDTVVQKETTTMRLSSSNY